MEFPEAYEAITQLKKNIGAVFIGKEEVIDFALVAFLAEGHLLLDDVPGVGKTLLGQALARSLDASFSRIQFTSDLLPSDVVGGDFYQQSTQTFQFLRGPIFSNVVLADEVNRTPPRTQSATLEAMNVKFPPEGRRILCRALSLWSRRKTLWNSKGFILFPKVNLTVFSSDALSGIRIARPS